MWPFFLDWGCRFGKSSVSGYSGVRWQCSRWAMETQGGPNNLVMEIRYLNLNFEVAGDGGRERERQLDVGLGTKN